MRPRVGAVYEAHRQHADSVTGLALQPWGAQAFHAVLLGYRFLIAAEQADPAIRYRKLTGLAHADGGLIPGAQICLCGARARRSG
jgi:hypothetical protein